MVNPDYIPLDWLAEGIKPRISLPSLLPGGLRSGLRPVLHPSHPLPDQPLLSYPQAAYREDNIIILGPAQEAGPLQEEFFVRELPALNDDAQSLLRLVREVGVPRLPSQLLRGSGPKTGKDGATLQTSWVYPKSEPPQGVPHLEVRWGLQALKAASVTYCQFAADSDKCLLENWTEYDFEIPKEAEKAPEAFALFWTTLVVAAGLEPFQPRIGFDIWRSDDPVLQDHGLTGINYAVDLYQAVCAQLASFIGTSSAPKQCANENCRKWFYKRLEKTEKGQRRSQGVMYCSTRCAKATGERKRRRKQRQDEKVKVGQSGEAGGNE